MRILVLAGSPRKGGNSDTLAGVFAEAARSKGHEVDVFRTADHKIAGCRACDCCWQGGGAPCVIKDDMQTLYPLFDQADMVVFATPCYYFGFPAQLKVVIDRLYPFSKEGKAEPFSGKKCAMILCGADEDEASFEGAVQQYELILDYLNWEDSGVLIAPALFAAGDVNGTEWLEAARDLAMDL